MRLREDDDDADCDDSDDDDDEDDEELWSSRAGVSLCHAHV